MAECYGNNFILNGDLQPSGLFDTSLVYDGESLYEVIRLIKGTPVFYYDHMERLGISAKNQNKDLLADPYIVAAGIIKLTRSERKKDINIKIVFNYNNGVNNWMVYFIESVYPSKEQYKLGVKGILFKAERNDPESKVINIKLRSEISHSLINRGGYEAILVNSENLITEGSRSNIFFLKNDVLHTAPDNLILKGITRKYILDICRSNSIQVKYECVHSDEIGAFEAAFMTGTSPMLLPYCRIDEIHFNVRLPLLDELRRLYVLKAEESIRLFRPEY